MDNEVKEEITGFRFVWVNLQNTNIPLDAQASSSCVDFETCSDPIMCKRLIYTLLNRSTSAVDRDLCIEYRIQRTYEIVSKENWFDFIEALKALKDGKISDIDITANSRMLYTNEKRVILKEYSSRLEYYDLCQNNKNVGSFQDIANLGHLLDREGEFSLYKTETFRRLCLHTRADDILELRQKLEALGSGNLTLSKSSKSPQRIISV